MPTPYEIIYNKSPYLAKLTDGNGELATVFIQSIQAVYLFLTKSCIDPATLKYNTHCNSDGLVFSLEGRRGQKSMCRDFYTKRFQDYAKIMQAMKSITNLFMTIYRYSKDHKNLTPILSKSGNLIVIKGEKKYEI